MEQNGPSGISRVSRVERARAHFVPFHTQKPPRRLQIIATRIFPFSFFAFFALQEDLQNGLGRVIFGMAKAACNACGACGRTLLLGGRGYLGEVDRSKFLKVQFSDWHWPIRGERPFTACSNHQSIQHSRLFWDAPSCLHIFCNHLDILKAAAGTPLEQCGLRSMPHRDKFSLSLPSKIIFYA